MYKRLSTELPWEVSKAVFKNYVHRVNKWIAKKLISGFLINIFVQFMLVVFTILPHPFYIPEVCISLRSGVELDFR